MRNATLKNVQTLRLLFKSLKQLKQFSKELWRTCSKVCIFLGQISRPIKSKQKKMFCNNSPSIKVMYTYTVLEQLSQFKFNFTSIRYTTSMSKFSHITLLLWRRHSFLFHMTSLVITAMTTSFFFFALYFWSEWCRCHGWMYFTVKTNAFTIGILPLWIQR